MSEKLRVVIAQLNATVGHVTKNCDALIEAAQKAQADHSADVIVFPELFLTGYPAEDLLYREAFLEQVDVAIEKIKRDVKDIHCIVSYPKKTKVGLQNAASVFYNGEELGFYAKQCLPNFSVFDEARYFKPGSTPLVIPINGVPVGVVVCEDLWHDGPVKQSVDAGAKVILSPNASPFSISKDDKRKSILKGEAKKSNVIICYTNLLGGQDDLVFDGGSMILNGEGEVCAQAPFFEESLMPVDIELDGDKTNVIKQDPPKPLTHEERAYKAILMGLKDYVEKNGFPGILLGLSGGIDSALSAAIAVDAIGAENVTGVLMPSRYTSDESIQLALDQVKMLGIKHEIISIEEPFDAFLDSLSDIFVETEEGITEQNLQARCRGTTLMALSNKFGSMVLSTGNRSELAVGYATLYGDMAGGFCAISDVPKTLVYKLSEYRNTLSHVIPQSVIDRPPTAELAENQLDTDSLPPYDQLDHILELYIDLEHSVDEITNVGFDRDVVVNIIRQVQRNEYKRRQAAPGVRLRERAFGRGRRYPITRGYREL